MPATRTTPRRTPQARGTKPPSRCTRATSTTTAIAPASAAARVPPLQPSGCRSVPSQPPDRLKDAASAASDVGDRSPPSSAIAALSPEAKRMQLHRGVQDLVELLL